MPFFLVGLSGPSCSGKSSAADIFHDNGLGLRIRLDGFYRGDEKAYRNESGDLDWEDIRSFDADGAARALRNLRDGKATPIPTYEREFHRVTGTEDVDPAIGLWKFIVADSIFCLDDPLFPLFDFVVHMHIDEDLLVHRRRERQKKNQQGEWNYSDRYHESCMRPSLARLASLAETRQKEDKGKLEIVDVSTLSVVAAIVKVYDRIVESKR